MSIIEKEITIIATKSQKINLTDLQLEALNDLLEIAECDLQYIIGFINSFSETKKIEMAKSAPKGPHTSYDIINLLRQLNDNGRKRVEGLIYGFHVQNIESLIYNDN